jgi:hypothetical protein
MQDEDRINTRISKQSNIQGPDANQTSSFKRISNIAASQSKTVILSWPSEGQSPRYFPHCRRAPDFHLTVVIR